MSEGFFVFFFFHLKFYCKNAIGNLSEEERMKHNSINFGGGGVGEHGGMLSEFMDL